MNLEKDKILLIDGNSILYRIFFSTKKIIKDKEKNFLYFDKYGNPINILKGFAETFIKYRTKLFCNYKIMIAFDHPERNTYRHQYSFYKANRKRSEDYYSVFLPQYKLILDFLNLFGVKTFQSKSLEADDIIAILSKRFSKNNHKVEIITSDKDLFQLIDENININFIMQGKKKFTKINMNNLGEFIIPNSDEKADILPKQIIDFKSIVGDSSDNISGLFLVNEKNNNKIKRISVKSSLALIEKHKTIEELIKYSSKKLDESFMKQIYKQREKLIQNKRLISLITDNNIIIENNDDLVTKKINFKKLYIFLDHHNLKNLIKLIKKRKDAILNNCID